MIRWTGLAPWELEFPFPGSLTSIFLGMQGLSLKTQQLYAVVFLTRLMFKVVYEQVVLPEYLSRGRSRGWSRGWSRGVGG